MFFRFSLFISLTGIVIPVFAQDVNLYDARSLSLSGSNITCSDAWSGIDNPAGLGMFSFFNIAYSYNNRYLVPELNTHNIVSSIPTSVGNISPFFSYFGGKLYSESHLIIAYGKMLAKWLSLGINFGYHIQRIEAIYERESAITGQIGIIAIPAKGVRIGININNPNGSAYGRKKSEKLVSGLQTGISLSRDKSYLLALQVNYNEFETLTYSMGAECIIAELFVIRTGIKYPESLCFSFGTGFDFQRFSVEIGFEQHSILGLSTALTLSFKKR
jgi:hypothetical protein